MNVLGIDLGNANSAVVALDAGKVRHVPAADTNAGTTPSIVALTDRGGTVVGEAARRQAMTNPTRTHRSFVRRLAAEPEPGEPAAVDLVALLLGKLRRDAEAHLGGAVGDVVVTVPATATHRYRLALESAAERAGLRLLGTVCGPTAAALAYRPRRGQRLLAVDVGACSVGMSTVAATASTIDVRATVGADLGGADWDDRIVQHIITTAVTEHGIDLSLDPPALSQLADAAERAKIELSSTQATALELPHFATRARGLVSLSADVSRAELDTMTRDLLDRCADLYHRATRTGEADRMVLVGGASRTPAIPAMLRRLGCPQAAGVDVDRLVAEGACQLARMLTGQVDGAALVDVAPLSLRIETRGGLAIPLVRAGTALPASGSATFTTVRDDQRSVVIHIVEGESEIAAQNTSLGSFELTGLSAAPRGVPRIEVTVTAGGTIRASACDMQSDHSERLLITASTASAAPPAISDAKAVTLAR